MRRVLCVVAASFLPAAPAAAHPATVRTGPARFQIISPTLIRAEYAQNGRFEDRPTMTATRAAVPVPAHSARRAHGWLTIRTAALTLRYRIGSGPFSPANLRLSFSASGHRVTVAPQPGDAQGNLGGWRRALDLLDAPVQLNDGVLSRAGWYVLDDTTTVLLTPGSGPGYTVRAPRAGAYQDWYVFGYGHDYQRALEDLHALTGPAPLLPRSAFGVWFSRYYPYSESDYRDLVGQFRGNRVPLDTLSVDTDFKSESGTCCAQAAAVIAGAAGRPYSWDGWGWDSALFPAPRRFMDWAHGQGLSVALNIHPSISTDDPKWPQANAAAGGLTTSITDQCEILIADPQARCGLFDWTQPRQIAAYFALHSDFEAAGADMFWLDWCCDASSAVAPGLTADTWINSLYAGEQHGRGTRWPAFSRVGAAYSSSDGFDGDSARGGTGIFAEHRYTIQFTGDTCATWPMLAFEAQFSAAAAGVGLPYVSHDIGSFHGQPVNGQCGPLGTSAQSAHLPDDMYARWVALGTFQPLDRLHSDHGDRLPWEYGAAADSAAAAFLRLREALIPYTYTLAARAHGTGLPITGPLYLQWPERAAAYQHPSEYTFGADMVVEPVAADGDPAPASMWVPPGAWIDYFTGRRFQGPRTVTLSVPLDQLPVLLRDGAVLVTEPGQPYTPQGPQRRLIATAYGNAAGDFSLYDDAGAGFGYLRGRSTQTLIRHRRISGVPVLAISPATGRFPGSLRSRFWTARFIDVARPQVVLLNQRELSHRRWSYDRATRTLTVDVGSVRSARGAVISAGPA